MLKILTIFTGGTIGCAPPESGVKDMPGVGKAAAQKTWQDYFLLTSYIDRCGRDVEFNTLEPLETLSENMTTTKWNTLITALKNVDFSDFDGVIITHGTDTLAYTSALLSILLAHVEIPVMLVSSNEHLKSPAANGHKNFEDAVNFIHTQRGKTCGTYVAYSYDLRRTTIYLASQIKQSEAFIDRFESFTGQDFGYVENGEFYATNVEQSKKLITGTCPKNVLSLIGKLENCVMMVMPYVGLDYSRFHLSGVKAVLHGTYHSFTFCVDEDAGCNTSVGYFHQQCLKSGVDLYFAPFSSGDVYASTDAMMKQGARFIPDCGVELAYAKLLVAYNIFSSDTEIREFLQLKW